VLIGAADALRNFDVDNSGTLNLAELRAIYIHIYIYIYIYIYSI